MARKDRQPWLASAKRKTDAAMALMMAVGRVQASDADPQPSISSFLNNPLFA